MVIKTRPAKNVVKIIALKGLKEMVECQGMLPKETLRDIVRTGTLFMAGDKVRAKIVGRYAELQESRTDD